MLRYHYPTKLRPPAPFVYVTLRNPVTSAEVTNVAAQLDTAADCTVIPASLVRTLELPQIGKVTIAGVGGNTLSMPIYPTLLAIDALSAQPVEVAAHEEEEWVLLGRDVINVYRMVLDGPQLALDIE